MVNATKYKLKNAEKCLNNFFTKYPLFMEYLYPDYVAMYTELSKTTTLNDIELMETWLALVYPIMCLLEEGIKIRCLYYINYRSNIINSNNSIYFQKRF